MIQQQVNSIQQIKHWETGSNDTRTQQTWQKQ